MEQKNTTMALAVVIGLVIGLVIGFYTGSSQSPLGKGIGNLSGGVEAGDEPILGINCDMTHIVAAIKICNDEEDQTACNTAVFLVNYCYGGGAASASS